MERNISNQMFHQGRTMAYLMVLQGRDAACLPVECRHPALRQHQHDLEEHMQPNDNLLDYLVASEIISRSDRQQIVNDISQLGQVKRILWKIDRVPDGPMQLVDALGESGSDANMLLSRELKETLENLQTGLM